MPKPIEGKIRVQCYFTVPDFERIRALCLAQRRPVAVSRYVAECAVRMTAAAEKRSREAAG